MTTAISSYILYALCIVLCVCVCAGDGICHQKQPFPALKTQGECRGPQFRVGHTGPVQERTTGGRECGAEGPRGGQGRARQGLTPWGEDPVISCHRLTNFTRLSYCNNNTTVFNDVIIVRIWLQISQLRYIPFVCIVPNKIRLFIAVIKVSYNFMQRNGVVYQYSPCKFLMENKCGERCRSMSTD